MVPALPAAGTVEGWEANDRLVGDHPETDCIVISAHVREAVCLDAVNFTLDVRIDRCNGHALHQSLYGNDAP